MTEPPAWVVYAESALPADRTNAPAATGPFQHLRYALYLGEAESPAELLYATGSDLPLRGQRASTAVPFGDHQLLLVTTSDVTLGSATSRLLPSAIAIVGAALAGAAALVTDRLLRKRDEAQEAYGEQRQRAETLQRSLLPARLPTIGHLATATRYWPAERESEVGGDFFDVFPLDGRRTAVVIGDVCGKGITAAALTGLARHTIRAAARHVTSPSDVLLWTHDAVEAHGIGTYVTACFGILSLHDDGTVGFEVALGGHPAPIIATADGRVARFGQPGTVLGLVPPSVTTTATTLFPGDTLVLYTDGITDAPGDAAISDDALLAAVGAHHGESPDAVADGVRRLIDDHRPEGSDDDIALVIVRVEPEVAAEPIGPAPTDTVAGATTPVP
jgi:serine phosphatase RsbU (regulator of sigma subunit)